MDTFLNLNVIAYLIYLIIGISLTTWVAHVLFHHAKVFFDDIFHNNIELSTSVNKLLKTGFYLLNIGLILFLLKLNGINTYKEMFELLSVKIGMIVLVLGAMHLGNVYLFFKLRKKAISFNAYRKTDFTELGDIERDVLGE